MEANEVEVKTLATLRGGVEIFKDIGKLAGALVEEGNIIVREGKVLIKQLNETHVAMLNVEIPCETLEGGEVRVRMADFNKALSHLVGDVKITITNKNVIFESGEGGRKITIKTLEGHKEAKSPALKFAAAIEASGAELYDLFNVADFGDVVTVEAKDGKAVIVTKSDGYEVEYETKAEGEARATYALEYIIPVLRALRGAERVRFEFSSKMPCRIISTINNVNVEVLVAPRVE